MATSPSTDNYFIGKGELYFDRWDSDESSTGERDVGNTPSFSLTPNVETLEHFSSRSGIRSKDKEVDITQSLALSFTLDEYNIENLAMALYGDGVETLSQGDGNVGAEAMTLYHDKWVKMDFRNISISSVGIAGYTEGTDFEVDNIVGRIKALSTGSIADGEAVTVSYTYGAATWSYAEIFGRKPVEGLLRFKGKNDVGDQYEAELWHVKLRMTSDLSFVSEEWSTIEFEGEVLDDSSNHPNSPFGRVIGPITDISES